MKRPKKRKKEKKEKKEKKRKKTFFFLQNKNLTFRDTICDPAWQNPQKRPRNKKWVIAYHMKGELFSFSMVNKIISIMHWTLKVEKHI